MSPLNIATQGLLSTPSNIAVQGFLDINLGSAARGDGVQVLDFWRPNRKTEWHITEDEESIQLVQVVEDEVVTSTPVKIEKRTAQNIKQALETGALASDLRQQIQHIHDLYALELKQRHQQAVDTANALAHQYALRQEEEEFVILLLLTIAKDY